MTHRYPGLHAEKSRHGKLCWYFRTGHGKRIRILGDLGSAEWRRNFELASGGPLLGVLANETPLAVPAKNTLAALIARYQDSTAWRRFAPSTRSTRAAIYRRAIDDAGDMAIAVITKGTIRSAISQKRETPFAADQFLKCMRALFRWALDAGLASHDPTEGVRGAGQRSVGFRVWTEAEIARFEAYWPIGTRERLALSILLFTGLRRGDAARIGPQHVRNGVICLRMEKTNRELTIPLLPELAAVIAATKTSDLAFIVKTSGAPLDKEAFGHWFRRSCLAAGCPGRAHGLRKAGATRAANNGATVAQLEAIFGWSGGRMASLYTRSADREKLARGAMTKLRRDGE